MTDTACCLYVEQVDPQWYPDWPQLIAQLEASAQGPIKMLGYMNPYLVNQTGRDPSAWMHNYFDEAASLGDFRGAERTFFCYCENNVHEKRWRCRKFGTQPARVISPGRRSDLRVAAPVL